MTFIRYIATQLLAYAIDMGGFLLMLHLGLLSPVAANAGGKIAAGLFAFVTHRHFTFRAGAGEDRMRQAVRYFALLALNVPLSSGVLAVVLLWVHPPAAAKLIADALCVMITYWLSKTFVFVRTGQDGMAPADSGRNKQ